MNTGSCRVLLVDDHPLFRCGVAQLIAAQSDFEVVGEAASAVWRERETDCRLAEVERP